MAPRYDLLIRGGLIISGSGVQRNDVGIKGEKIAAVAPEIPPAEATG